MCVCLVGCTPPPQPPQNIYAYIKMNKLKTSAPKRTTIAIPPLALRIRSSGVLLHLNSKHTLTGALERTAPGCARARACGELRACVHVHVYLVCVCACVFARARVLPDCFTLSSLGGGIVLTRAHPPPPSPRPPLRAPTYKLDFKKKMPSCH